MRKYDAAGNWSGPASSAPPAPIGAPRVAVAASGVYVAGTTSGTLPGQASTGGQDAFVRKYDFDGNVLWTRQFGTAGTDTATGIAADASGVYVAGSTRRHLPGARTSAGGSDAFVRKYDAGGTDLDPPVRHRRPGSGQRRRRRATGVYVAGFVAGTLPGETSAGGQDAFVRKYDVGGGAIWTGQFGTAATDSASGVTVGTAGLFVAGSTTGTFPGQTSAGLEDAFVAKIVDAVGNTPPSNVSLNLNSPIDRERHGDADRLFHRPRRRRHAHGGHRLGTAARRPRP